MLKHATMKKIHLNLTLFFATNNWVNIQLFSFSSNKMNWSLTHQLKMYFWASGRNFQLSLNWKLKKTQPSKHDKRFLVMVLSLSHLPCMSIFRELQLGAECRVQRVLTLRCRTQGAHRAFLPSPSVVLGGQCCAVLQPRPGQCPTD